MQYFALLLTLAAMLASPVYAAPPLAAVRDVIDTHHGVAVHDPYRDLEDIARPETQAWMKTQSEHARAVLDGLPGRAALAARIAELTASSGGSVNEVVRSRGQRLFLLKRAAGGSQFKLIVRDGLEGGRERVLVDPERVARATGVPHAINYMLPSWDGRYVAYGISAGGSEDASLRIVSADSGRELIRPIPRVSEFFGSWTPDSRALAFNQLRRLPRSAPASQTYLDSTAMLLRLDQPNAQPRPLFGTLVERRLGLQALDQPSVHFRPGSRFMVARTTDPLMPEQRTFVAPLADLARARPRWRPVLAEGDVVKAARLAGDRLYLRVDQGAPRGRWMVLDLARGQTLAQASVAVAEPERGVLQDLHVGDDGLIVSVRQGFGVRPLRVGADGVAREDVAPSIAGSLSIVPDLDDSRRELWLESYAWIEPYRIWRLPGNGSPAVDTGLLPAALPPGTPALTAIEVQVPSHDGVQVPLAIVHRADLVKDGQRPTLLQGYGAYGSPSDSTFSRRAVAWLERGGVLAIVDPRGGGAYGEPWRLGGFKTSKPNTWKDGLAAARYLVEAGYTQPARLAVIGASAGGIFVGRAITEAPQQFGAAVIQVGVLDLMRSETTANGFANIPEFGTVNDPAEFKALLAMSTYHQVRDGVAYPAVLITQGMNDSRVDVWHSTKTAARLQAARPDGRPVLLWLDPQSGHGLDSTAEQWDRDHTDLYAFLFWQLGRPGDSGR